MNDKMKRIQYQCDGVASSMTIDATLFALVDNAVGDATKWCRNVAADTRRGGTSPGKISAEVRRKALLEVARPDLID